MKIVLRRIYERKRQFRERPLFTRILDERLAPRARLAFLPGMAHFIMTFGDLNRYVIPFANPETELERAVNVHAEEDEAHWPWYLEDLRDLGLDPQKTRTEWLRELFGDANVAARRLSYRLIELLAGTDAVERLALIEVMEETGNVMFSTLERVSRRMAAEEGRELKFCGTVHLERETGHAIGSDHRLLAEIALDDEKREHILRLVDQAYDAFDAFIDELYASVRGEKTGEIRRDVSLTV